MLTNKRVKRTIFFKIPLLFFFCSMSCVYPVSASLQLDQVTQPSTAGPKIISISDTSSITATDHESKLGQLPIGINLDATNYYNPSVPFNDIMKTASKMLTYDVSGKDSSWNTNVLDQIPRDENGWPLELPFVIDGTPHGIRMLVNNTVEGEHVLLHDGNGDYEWHIIDGVTRDGRTYLTLNGKGGHVYLQISRSDVDNPLRNMRLLPVEYEEAEENMPLFRPLYVQGLRPFHALRFMDWTRTNNSEQVYWQDRSRPEHYTQGLDNGTSLEYAIELANTLNEDVWFCVPHRASDDYIRRMAQLIRDTLHSNLTCYIEYSNELWNWQFAQANWVQYNGVSPDWSGGVKEETRTVEQYVESGLTAINPKASNHPEKDAFMMARTFRIFSEVFVGQSERLVRVAAVQHAWVDTTRRILEYLFETDGIGCDAVSPAGYLGFAKEDHLTWLEMDPASVTPEMIVQAARLHAQQKEWLWTEQTAAYAQKYNIDFLVYEGGQHMQPWQQDEWDYNQAVWDAQISSDMYDLYQENFIKHTASDVNCTLFMAYSYLGFRESRYGSWGHLETLQQLEEGDLLQNAPKYQALLDANIPKAKKQ